ncbi:hypothetical protein GGR57DRAFT_293111 [Xylariaceae sp. FL1272]|nr:hypothetical protein GGR57DRAFT_293111 [Xylariaceae sp. FL1272]
MILRRFTTNPRPSVTATATWCMSTTHPLRQTPPFNAASRVRHPHRLVSNYHAPRQKSNTKHTRRKRSPRRNPQPDEEPDGPYDYVIPVVFWALMSCGVDYVFQVTPQRKIREKSERIIKTTREFEKQHLSANVTGWDKEPTTALRYLEYARTILTLHHEILSLKHSSFPFLIWAWEKPLEDLGPLPRSLSDRTDRGTTPKATGDPESLVLMGHEYHEMELPKMGEIGSKMMCRRLYVMVDKELKDFNNRPSSQRKMGVPPPVTKYIKRVQMMIDDLKSSGKVRKDQQWVVYFLLRDHCSTVVLNDRPGEVQYSLAERPQINLPFKWGTSDINQVMPHWYVKRCAY